MSKHDKTTSFISKYLKLYHKGSHLSECESLQTKSGKRYHFKINGVVVVSPYMLNGEIGKLARKMKTDNDIPNYINLKGRKRQMQGRTENLQRWLPQRWTPYVEVDESGRSIIWKETHMWYGGYYVDPYVASALSQWVFHEYEKLVNKATGSVQGKDVIARPVSKYGVERDQEMKIERGVDKKHAAVSYFNLKDNSELNSVIRTQRVVTNSKNEKFILAYDLTGKKQEAAASLKDVAKAMRQIFGDDLTNKSKASADRKDREDDKDAKYDEHELQASITAGEAVVKNEFIAFLKKYKEGTLKELDDLKIEEPCPEATSKLISKNLRKRLFEAAKSGDTEHQKEVWNAMKKQYGQIPEECLDVFKDAMIPPGSNKTKNKSKRKYKPAVSQRVKEDYTQADVDRTLYGIIGSTEENNTKRKSSFEPYKEMIQPDKEPDEILKGFLEREVLGLNKSSRDKTGS